jgi:endonuclease YncB( thermonuclease family)
VNTPEKREQGYQDAKKALEKLIGDKDVTVDTISRDKWGRPIANVKLGNQSVNQAMKKYQKK